MSKLFSDTILAHYGIPGQKWGQRRWQYEDGRFNEEGKERYFGKNGEYNIGKGMINGIKSLTGIRNKDSLGMKVSKAVIGTASTLGRALPIVYPILGFKKNNENAKKLGIIENKVKSLMKSFMIGNAGSDMYNIRRKKGEGRLEAYLGAVFIDSLLNGLTLGKHIYDKKEKYGLEHSEL